MATRRRDSRYNPPSVGLKKLARKLAQNLYRKLRHRPEHDVLAAMSPERHAEQVESDLASLRHWIDGLDRAVGAARDDAELFRPDSPALDKPEGRLRLRRRFQALLDYTIALDSIKNLHGGFAALDGGTLEHARSFLLCYAAFLAQYAAGYRFIRRVGRNKRVAKLLDEPAPELGLDGGLLDRLKWNVLHVADVAKLRAGRSYYRELAPRLRVPDWLDACLARADRDARRALAVRAVSDFMQNAFAILRAKAFRTWFPVQKGLSLAIGHTHVRTPPPLITKVHLDSLRPRLLPGDIMLVRRSWKLSNIGLPGFWPHAALYVGTPKRMRAFLDGDPDVRALCRKHAAQTDDVPGALSIKFPGKWREFVARPNEVIEAVSPTVTFHTLDQACDADQLAILRPRVPKAAVARAIYLAFHYHGRKYDFDFDFETDHELVCSEVVYKAYEGSLKLPLLSVAGRLTLPPNEICAMFERERATPAPQLEFVDFLDGRADKGHVVHGTADDFCASHKRSKWEFIRQG